jgi:hypothetical protein
MTDPIDHIDDVSGEKVKEKSAQHVESSLGAIDLGTASRLKNCMVQTTSSIFQWL